MVTFSHNKYPFDEGSNSIESLIEWPFDVSKSTAEMTKILSFWKVEKWLEFFNTKLLERSVFLQEKANKTRGEADAYEVSSKAIIAVISGTK